jgi:hypothetical protein
MSIASDGEREDVVGDYEQDYNHGRDLGGTNDRHDGHGAGELQPDGNGDGHGVCATSQPKPSVGRFAGWIADHTPKARIKTMTVPRARFILFIPRP